MRVGLVSLFVLLSALQARAQQSSCTEGLITQGKLPAADDVFVYMPPYGRPVVGKRATQAANAENFGGRSNITRSWVGERRVVRSSSGDMAYEYGTLRVGYDEAGAHTEFDAVMLTVYMVKNGECQIVAMTMQPIEEPSKK